VNKPRIYLHLAAFVAPLAAAVAWCAVIYRSELANAAGVVAVVGGLGILAAQMAALLRWRALEARAREGRGAWLNGIGMAAITHALFGVFLDVALVLSVGGWREAVGTGKPTDLLIQSLVFFIASVMPIGLVTFPATALFATWIAALRAKELGDVAA
jgi:hypothetical protein